VKLLIVANWKCNPVTLKEARFIFDSIRRGVKNIRGSEIVICPPFVYLSSQILKKSGKVKLGAQNCFWEEKGAFTGEISPAQLRDLGCQYVILGHSERRKYFGESDQIVNQKIRKALKLNLGPILCVGEDFRQKESGLTIEVIRSQVREGLRKISRKQAGKIAIAYEPIWAIGSGNPCEIEEAQSIGLLIRKIVSQLYGITFSRNFRILYGGSMKAENAAPYIKEAGLNGLLIGGASLKPKEFIEIIKGVKG